MEKLEIVVSTLIPIATFITVLLAFRDRIFKSGKKEKSIEDKVADLEKSDTEFKKSIEGINTDIKNIKENHLSHIQSDINKININLAEINTTLKIKMKD